jgi:hypothetical protein
MENGLERLREAARIVDKMDANEHVITLEIFPEGVRASITWHDGDTDRYITHENNTSWHALHPKPDTKNPLVDALDELVRVRTEFST